MAEVRPAFTDFIVCLIPEFAVGEDRQRPLFSSSQNFHIYLFLAQKKGGNGAYEVFHSNRVFSAMQVLAKRFKNQNEAILEDNSVR